MTRKELEESEDYNLHHTAKHQGYVSRKLSIDNLIAAEYDGRFGKGYTIRKPRWDTSQYVTVEYWVYNNNNQQKNRS